MPLPQRFGVLQCLHETVQLAIHDILLLCERFGELNLMVVQQVSVGDDYDWDADAEGVEDRAGACKTRSVTSLAMIEGHLTSMTDYNALA